MKVSCREKFGLVRMRFDGSVTRIINFLLLNVLLGFLLLILPFSITYFILGASFPHEYFYSVVNKSQ